jgi:21S rRNA (GM2251-2'-O)-methyltransferase
VADVVERATAQGAAVRYVDRHELNLLSDNRPHQGLVLDCAPLELEEGLQAGGLPPQPPSAAPPVWLALDEVSDPQNLGAILRSALFLGASGVVVCARNSAPLSPVVSKASAGAMELLPVHEAGNLPSFLEASAANGWVVLGADAGNGAIDVAGVRVAGPTLLVLGSEGGGMRTNVRRACSQLVCVPGGASGDSPADRSAGVDSLNVSVATGILLASLIGSARAARA